MGLSKLDQLAGFSFQGKEVDLMSDSNTLTGSCKIVACSWILFRCFVSPPGHQG